MNTSKTELKPVVVVIAYNRDQSLFRLLNSLNEAHYPSDDIRLVISIDRSDNAKVENVAKGFFWNHGEKEIVLHAERLGLKKHVLSCGDLSLKYGSIIMLEDDLYVSPYFYTYAQEAAEFYYDDNTIAGVSLYNHRFNEVALLPFYPIEDGNDVYFLQIASSWGQLFWGHKWQKFIEWHIQNDILSIKEMPPSFVNWSENSWKKYFIAFLIDTHRYFIYPRISLTTNFSDEGGQHFDKGTSLYQVPLLSGPQKWNFIGFDESEMHYDAYCEIESKFLQKKYNKLLEYGNIAVDLYGCKPLAQISGQYLLTSKPSKKPVYSFGLHFKSLHSNIDRFNTGGFFALTDKTDCYETALTAIRRKTDFFNFFYRKTSVKMYLLLMLRKILGR